MNTKELFMLIDKMDERFIDEAWGSTESESFDEVDYENKRGVSVVMERRPFRAAGFVLTAACFLLLGAGAMSLINVFTGNSIQPSSSMEIPSSYVGSSTSSESSQLSESSDGSEDFSNSEPVISDIENLNGVYDFAIAIIPPSHETCTEGAEKMNNWDYAKIEVKETNATEEHPIIAQILKSSPKGGLETISEKIYITGRGIYRIYYTTLRGAGSYSYLYLVYPAYHDVDLDSDAKIVGTWTP